MKINKSLLTVVVFSIFCIGGATAVSAQNMQGTVVTKQVKFARGKSSASLRGTAKYAMSYAFDLSAKAGQTMEISLTGNNSELSFSLIAPDTETIEGAFSVDKWIGELPQSGKYSIVVVMNDENAKIVPFTLNVKVK